MRALEVRSPKTSRATAAGISAPVALCALLLFSAPGCGDADETSPEATVSDIAGQTAQIPRPEPMQSGGKSNPIQSKGAYHNAVSARERASSIELDDERIGQALARGERQFKAASEFQESEDYAEATASFTRARLEFETAIAIEPAARLRIDALLLNTPSSTRGLEDLGLVGRLHERAEGDFAKGRWGDAARYYAVAVSIHRGLIKRGEPDLSPEAQANTWAESRAARWEDATRAAKSSLEEGDRLRDAAQEKLALDEFETALQLFEEARASYRSVESPEDIILLENAEVAIVALRGRARALDGPPCSGLDEPLPTLCGSAERHATRALREFEAGEAHTAGSSFSSASELYRQVERSRGIIALAETVRQARAVAIQVDAKELAGPQFEEADSLYTDAGEQHRLLDFNESETLYRDAKIEFEGAAKLARLKDEMKRGRERESENERARIADRTAKAEQDRLRKSRDDKAKADRLAAARKAVEREKALPVERTRVAEIEPAIIRPQLNANQVVTDILNEYRAAYEARDVDRLANVWQMKPKQFTSTSQFFKQAKKIQISVASKNARPEGNGIAFEFNQQIKAKGMREVSASYNASLTETSNGWQITDLKPIK